MRSAIHNSFGEPADVLVVFGITGDLAKRMTLKALYDLCENGTLKVPVIGVGRTDWIGGGPNRQRTMDARRPRQHWNT